MAHESIWWGLYHGDRFLSLLLGLPYGISDSHCDLTMPNFGGEFMHPLVFINTVSKVAGRVIDRNQGTAEQSFAWALQLDQELEDLWKKLDPTWLDYSELLATPESNAAELRERIMAQIIYHQIRVYLHIPFMLKSATNSRFTYSRTACLNGSREVLRLYQALRNGTAQPLYECKAVDFIGFTAAVLIQIGLFNFVATHHQDANKMKEAEADVRLIEISIDIFRRASSEKGGKVALQSAEVLEKMQAKFKSGCPTQNSPCEDGECDDLVIPYFGTISIRRGGQTLKGPLPPPPTMSPTASTPGRSTGVGQGLYTPTSEKSGPGGTSIFSQPQTTSTQSLNLTPRSSLSTHTPATSTFPALDPSPFVSYDGFYNFTTLTEDGSATGTNTGGLGVGVGVGAGAGAGTSTSTQINDDSMNNFPLPTNNFSWQHMPMDIDQDWSWFLNDSQTQGVGMGSSNHVGQGTMDAFTTGFTGFG